MVSVKLLKICLCCVSGSVIVHRVPRAQDDKSVHMAFAFKLNDKIYYPVIKMDSLTNEVGVQVILGIYTKMHTVL